MERKDRSEHDKACQEKKVWITPEIFDSPVITVTGGGGQEGGSWDGSSYS